MYLNLKKFAQVVKEVMSAQFFHFLDVMHFPNVLQDHTLFESMGFVFVLDAQ